MANHVAISTNENGEVVDGTLSTSNSAPSDVTPASKFKTDNGSVSIDGNGVVIKQRVSYNSNTNENSEAYPESVLATATSKMGRPLEPYEVNGDSRVRVNGMEMTVKSAAAAGFMMKEGNEWVDVAFSLRSDFKK